MPVMSATKLLSVLEVEEAQGTGTLRVIESVGKFYLKSGIMPSIIISVTQYACGSQDGGN